MFVFKRWETIDISVRDKRYQYENWSKGASKKKQQQKTCKQAGRYEMKNCIQIFF